jgi:hypothetical protein
MPLARVPALPSGGDHRLALPPTGLSGSTTGTVSARRPGTQSDLHVCVPGRFNRFSSGNPLSRRTSLHAGLYEQPVPAPKPATAFRSIFHRTFAPGFSRPLVLRYPRPFRGGLGSTTQALITLDWPFVPEGGLTLPRYCRGLSFSDATFRWRQRLFEKCIEFSKIDSPGVPSDRPFLGEHTSFDRECFNLTRRGWQHQFLKFPAAPPKGQSHQHLETPGEVPDGVNRPRDGVPTVIFPGEPLPGRPVLPVEGEGLLLVA